VIQFLTEFYALKRRLRFVALAVLFAANLTVLFFVESGLWRAALIALAGLLALLAGRLIQRLQPRHVVVAPSPGDVDGV